MGLYIGLMSGTSADAIDAALVSLKDKQPKIIHKLNLPIPNKARSAVFDLAVSSKDEIDKIHFLDHTFAQLFSEAVKKLCLASNVEAKDIAAIGSHGQTIRHYPPSNETLGYSLQVGDPNIIAEQTGITTIADFRRRDIAAGGQGAPLAPGLHNAIFRSQTTDRIILNLGGIANITYLPATGEVIGFDTGPANGLMDSWCQLNIEQPYDKGGEWARTGKLNEALLSQLMQHSFFSTPPPKSTGREDFNRPWIEQQLEQFGQNIKPEDVQATLLELTTKSISHAIDAIDKNKLSQIYFCGGGAHNTILIDSLRHKLSPRTLASTDALGVAPDWVEAVAFAWLAKQTLDRQAGNIPSVTGANKEVILGGIYLA